MSPVPLLFSWADTVLVYSSHPSSTAGGCAKGEPVETMISCSTEFKMLVSDPLLGLNMMVLCDQESLFHEERYWSESKKNEDER
jgi:hypothetical protein